MARQKDVVSEGIYTLDGVQIPYVLHRKAVKNYNLRVRDNGSLYLSVPHRAPKDAHLTFLARHEAFVRRALSRKRTLQQGAPTLAADGCPADGEVFTIYGVNYRIMRHKTANGVFLPFSHTVELREHPEKDGFVWDIYYKPGILQQTMEQGTYRRVLDKAESILREAIDRLLPRVQQRFAEVLPLIFRERANAYPYLKYVFTPKEIRIRAMKSRWGSCAVNKGIVTFNLRLLSMPEICTEYVIYHELAHFLVPDHSDAFHALMRALMPDYRSVRAMLNGKESS